MNGPDRRPETQVVRRKELEYAGLSVIYKLFARYEMRDTNPNARIPSLGSLFPLGGFDREGAVSANNSCAINARSTFMHFWLVQGPWIRDILDLTARGIGDGHHRIETS